MKRLLTISLLAFLISLEISAQAPKGINYQGVARDGEGKAIASKQISVRISILKNSADGDTEYKETHEVTTNAFGLFTLVIGQGKTNTGSFDFISWAVGNKWLQIELDPNGGNAFLLIGSQQLMSVPYAFYAQYSGNGLTAGQGIAVTNGVINNTGDNDNSSTNELNTGITLGADHKLKITDAGGTKEADLSSLTGAAQNLNSVLTTGNDAGNQQITNLLTPVNNSDAATKGYVDGHQDGDASATNEIQDLSFTGNTLKITNNTAPAAIDLSLYLDNTDNQDLSLSGNTLALSNDATPVDLSQYTQSLTIQTLDADTRSIGISGGNSITLDVGDNDNSSTNELQTIHQVLSQSNDAGGLKLTNLGMPTIDTDAATKLYADNLDALDSDKDATNELQNLSQVLAQGTDANNARIQNVGTPAGNKDATTKDYVDVADNALRAQIATTYAFKTGFSYTNSSGLIESGKDIPFTLAEFDDFNVLSLNAFTAHEDGTYVFIVDGSHESLLGAGAQLSLYYNGVKFPFAIIPPWGGGAIARFNSTLLFKMTVGQTVSLVGDNILIGGKFSGSFFGFKL